MKGAHEHKNLRELNFSDFVLKKGRCDKLLINPKNHKRLIFIYWISILGIFDIFWSCFIVAFEDTSLIVNLWLVPIYLFDHMS